MASDKPQQPRPENDPAAIEEAMYQLACIATQEGLRLGSYTEPSIISSRTAIEWYIAEPVRHSCQQGQFRLLQHLKSVVGASQANAILSRINARVHAEIVRPILNKGPVQ